MTPPLTTFDPDDLYQAAKRVVQKFAANGLTLSTAESCTGGLIAKLLTDVPGSSAVLAGGCVSYTNDVKIHVLGVPKEIIDHDTEVSESCAKAMADAARRLFLTDVAVSTTGYAGPSGGTPDNPVGTVYIAVSTKNHTSCTKLSAPPTSTRDHIRSLAALTALQGLSS